jgi:hypothetical protein
MFDTYGIILIVVGVGAVPFGIALLFGLESYLATRSRSRGRAASPRSS